jgi:cysteine desulfurase
LTFSRDQLYLDHAASGRPDPRWKEAWSSFFFDHSYNGETVHEDGVKAKANLNRCRADLAKGLGVRPEQLVFTSGGTEGNNTSAHLLAQQFDEPGVIWCSTTTHPSQREPALALVEKGWQMIDLPTLASGKVDTEGLGELPDPNLLAIEWVNSEAGFIQNVEELVSLCSKRPGKTRVWVDGVQGYGKLVPLSLKGIDAFVFSGHKLGAPVGIGGLAISNGLKQSPFLLGGGQQERWRSGTTPIPLVMALHQVVQSLPKPLSTLNDVPWPEGLPRLREEKDSYSPFIHLVDTRPVDGEILLHQLVSEGITVGLGSACRASRKKASPAHQALGLSDHESRQTLRISTSPLSEPKAVSFALERLKTLLDENRRFFK